MAGAQMGAALGQIGRLFGAGTVAGLSDAQLLERFLDRRDATAFEALVARHGPMVLAVCRGLLDDPHAAEDAFQATFLILAKKAGAIRGRDALGGWLHRVARRVALQANADARRRRTQERSAGALQLQSATVPRAEPRDDDRAAVHEEVARLPERYRLPVVLCYLEGRTHAEAAADLRWGEATVRRRLADARALLRSRLTRRGLAPACALLGVSSARQASAALPAAWVQASCRAVTHAAGRRAAASLAEGVLRAMQVGRIAQAVLAVTALAIVAGGLGAAGAAQGDDRARGAMAAPKERPRVVEAGPHQEGGEVEIRGRVLDPDGRPLAGAKIYLGGDEYVEVPPPHPVRAVSGPDGRFRFVAGRKELAGAAGQDRQAQPGVPLAALAEGHGPAWVAIDPGQPDREWTLKLVRDDVPITGRVLGLEGRPIAGARVTVNNLTTIPGGDAAAWVRTLEQNGGRANPDLWARMRDRLFLGGPGALPMAETGADGRFRLAGVGRDRIVVLTVEGPTVSTEFAVALANDVLKDLPVPLPGEGEGEGKLFGPRFDLTAAPGRAVEGVVRDRDTGRPLAGVKVSSSYLSHAITDAQGRYRLAGLPKLKEIEVTADPDGLPYLKAIKTADDTPGLGPIAVDIDLKRGVWVEGRVTDRATGRPLAATLEYFPFVDNPHLAEVPGYSGLNNNVSDESRYPTDPDGRFRAVALPGGGLLAVRAARPGYLTARPLRPEVAGNVLHAANFQYQMAQYQGLAEVRPPEGAESFHCDVALEPGREQRGTIEGPEGRPVAGARVYGLHGSFVAMKPLPGAEFTYVHPDPGRVESLTFIREQGRLGGVVEVKGDEPGPLRARLEPTGTVVGRLVDADGLPRPDVELLTLFEYKTRGDTIWGEHVNSRLRTDRDGRFRVENLVPGVTYELEAIGKKGTHFADGFVSKARWTVKPGEVQDWGDVREEKYRNE
jgi:RNA polymerase sigma factor (sigma-70 family)